jgi:peptidyl-dipeptidase A
MKLHTHYISCTLVAAIGFLVSCGPSKTEMNKKIDTFLEHYDSIVPPLQKEMNLAYWNASLSGSEADFQKVGELQMKLVEIYANKQDFELLKMAYKKGSETDAVKKRRVEVLYNIYLSSQADTALQKKIITLQNEIEVKYSNFRAEVNGKKLTDNDIEEILKQSKNSNELESAWKAHKAIGPVVANDILQLVKLRNQTAKELGFSNYHEMSLKLSDQDPKMISQLFDELDEMTAPAFAKLKAEIDSFFAVRYNVKTSELKPWHYQDRFFQEAPAIYPVDLDKYYKDKNIEILTRDYYSSIGLEVADIMEHSDLYEKPGKNQHAYCMDIDNSGDVRVLCNVKFNAYWMNTLLHEFGHAAYDKYIDPALPFDLRNPAHTFTTEAIAMMFGRMYANPQWIQDMTCISDEEKLKIQENCNKTLRLEQMVFSRWAQVMYRFEKSLYEDPDQDLNALWWKLVEKYQLVKKPEGRNAPDWASKIHIATSPCYYHNYLLGELLASQLHYYIVKNCIKSDSMQNQSYFSNKQVGKFLIQKVFIPGSLMPWNEMIEKATGEKLTAKYYSEQFAK